MERQAPWTEAPWEARGLCPETESRRGAPAGLELCGDEAGRKLKYLPASAPCLLGLKCPT